LGRQIIYGCITILMLFAYTPRAEEKLLRSRAEHSGREAREVQGEEDM
jgi:hypothetical protein